MEHILQFAIDIDDSQIKKLIKEGAVKKIIEDIDKDLRNEMFESNYYGASARLSSQAERIIRDFLEENKDEILQIVADKIYEKTVRTKKIQEIKKALKED